MNIEQAIKILNPETTKEALAEIEYYAGFNGKEAKLKAVNEACIIACDVMKEKVCNEKYNKSMTNIQ